MILISRINFRKSLIRRLLPSAIITATVFHLFLLLMTQTTTMTGDDEERFAQRFCEKNLARGRQSLASFLQPQRDTAIIMPKLIDAMSVERKFIACFVLSSPENAEIRHVIRDTWGSLVKPIFVIGRSANESIDDETLPVIRQEADIFNDIVLENFIDTYDNLTLKTGFAMKTFLKYYANSTYFMKIDDDVLLNWNKLREALEAAPKDSLVGKITRESRPVMDIKDKWFMPKCLYPDEFYPDYLQGPLYLIPGHLVESIFVEAQKMNFFSFEDVFWTGLVAGQRLNMSLHSDANFTFFYTPTSLALKHPCLLSEFVAIHKASPEVLIKSWQSYGVQDKCSEFLKNLSKFRRWWLSL